MTDVDDDPVSQRASGAPHSPQDPHLAGAPPSLPGQPSAGTPAGAKQRILDVADELFYSEGIRVVGVDRLISEAKVTKATFYKHYRSKDLLIEAYLVARRARAKDEFEARIAESPGPAEALAGILADIVAEVERTGFRGCAFLNAAVEYPDSRSRVREHVADHRDWYTEVIAGLLAQIGHRLPGEGADEFVLARDGAMVGSYAGDSIAASGALQRTAQRILADARK